MQTARTLRLAWRAPPHDRPSDRIRARWRGHSRPRAHNGHRPAQTRPAKQARQRGGHADHAFERALMLGHKARLNDRAAPDGDDLHRLALADFTRFLHIRARAGQWLPEQAAHKGLAIHPEHLTFGSMRGGVAGIDYSMMTGVISTTITSRRLSVSRSPPSSRWLGLPTPDFEPRSIDCSKPESTSVWPDLSRTFWEKIRLSTSGISIRLSPLLTERRRCRALRLIEYCSSRS